MTKPILTLAALKEARAFYRDQRDVVFDVETKGEHRLDPRRNQVFWLTLSAGGRTDVIPFGHPIGRANGITKEPRTDKNGKVRMFKVPTYTEPPKQLWPADVFEVLEPVFFGDRTLWGHNVKFDLESTAKYYDGVVPPPPYGCTMIAAHLINENLRTYRLGDCVKREYGYAYDKNVGKAVETYPFRLAAQYCHQDGTYTDMLRGLYVPQLRKYGLRGVFALEMDVLDVLCRMESNGSPIVDIEALRELDRDLDKQIVEITGRLYKLAGRPWNFNSHPQKVQIFYGKRANGGQGLKPVKHTESGAPSCDKEALEHYQGRNELVDAFIEFSELDKISGTYVKAYLGTNDAKAKDKSRNNAPPYNPDTGHIHANFKQSGTVTGRFSCSEPNLQNIPRPDKPLGKKIRGLFIAAPGEALIVADWSQIEYRILAQYSGDRKLIRAFQDGLDFHLYVASMLLGKPMDEVTPVESTMSKNTNFAVIYGAGIGKIAAMSGVKLAQAERFAAAHQRMLPGVYRFRDHVITTCRQRRPCHVKTMMGRVRRLPMINSHDRGTRAYAERQAVNTVIQGSAADLMKLAMVREDRLLKPGMTMNLTVHDELVTSVPLSMVEEGEAIVREAMMGTDIASLLRPVPLVADIKVVQRWSEAKD